MDLDFIKRVIDMVEEAEISELEIESEDGIRVVVKKGGGMPSMPVSQSYQIPQMPHPAPPAPATTPETVDDGLEVIKSPIVGTFYRAPAPDAQPFVDVGTSVSTDSVVCILEAMKVMNEIKSGVNGVIREILVENSEAVEYDQPLFKIEKK